MVVARYIKQGVDCNYLSESRILGCTYFGLGSEKPLIDIPDDTKPPLDQHIIIKKNEKCTRC